MTKEERRQWKTITTDEQAKAFIDLFWARRDPTPGTAKNEFRADFDERVKVADQRFHAGVAGSLTDRGKVFILMGSPTKIRRSGNGPQSTIQVPSGRPTGRPSDMGSSGGSVQGYSPKEIWEYEQGKTPLQLGQPLVQFAFIDQYGTSDWKLERGAMSDVGAIFESVAVSYVAEPDLRSAPVFTEAAAEAPAAAPAAAPAPALTELKSEAFRTAVEQSRASNQPSDKVYVSYGEFITPKGEHYVPVQLYVPKSAGLTPTRRSHSSAAWRKMGERKQPSSKKRRGSCPPRTASSSRARFSFCRERIAPISVSPKTASRSASRPCLWSSAASTKMLPARRR